MSSPALVAADDLEPMLEALTAGLIVALPTDTVFGLAGLVDRAAVGRIFAAKGRPADLALPVLVGRAEQVDQVASAFEQPAESLARRFWPGALTLVVPARPEVGALVGGSGTTVGVRWPNHRLVTELCMTIGPLAVTSANRHGRPPCTTATQVCEQFSATEVAVVVEGRAEGTPSTVVDCTGPRPTCVREGALSWAAIIAALGEGRPGW
jgi:L-threonylcarbamoyladenylate synthase